MPSEHCDLLIDRRYELSEIADALRYLGDGHTQGKVVIAV